MAAKQIQCPNCGATLGNEDLKGLQCPYCGSKIEKIVESKERSSRKSYQYDGIIPFTRSEEEAQQTLAWHLADEMDVPIEVFNHLSIKVKKTFVPMWAFEGSFKSPWSCQKVVWRRREYKEDGKTRYERYKEYYPANGVAVGDFSIFVSGVKRGYGYILYRESKIFSPELIDSDAIVKDLEISREKAWRSDKVKSHVEYLANEELRKTLPDDYEDLNSYYEYNYNHSACVLYPIYEVEFDYEGETYNNVVSGCTDILVEELYAPRQNLVNHENDKDLMDANDSSLVLSMTGWGVISLLIGVVLAFISGAHGHTLSLISAIILSVLGLAFPIVTYSRIEDEKKLRRNIAKDREEHDKQTRFRQLLDEPLLQPYREDMEETDELNIDSESYNEKVRKDKSSKTKFKIILVAMLAVTVGLYFASAIAKSVKERSEQVASENRMEKIKAAYNQITPQMIFHNASDESGHLRQDIRKKLTNLGFVRDDEYHNQTAEAYSLYIDGEESPIMQMVLNDMPHGLSEDHKKINDVCIKIPVLAIVDEYISTFKDNIVQSGFVVSSANTIKTTPLGTSLPFFIDPSDSYIRIGKTIRKQDGFSEAFYFNYDVVEFRKGYTEAEIFCYSHADSHIKSTEVEETVNEAIADTVMADDVRQSPDTLK